MEFPEQEVTLLDLEKEMEYKINFTSQLLDDSVIYKETICPVVSYSREMLNKELTINYQGQELTVNINDVTLPFLIKPSEQP